VETILPEDETATKKRRLRRMRFTATKKMRRMRFSATKKCVAFVFPQQKMRRMRFSATKKRRMRFSAI
jgi:hypothetical protein